MDIVSIVADKGTNPPVADVYPGLFRSRSISEIPPI